MLALAAAPEAVNTLKSCTGLAIKDSPAELKKKCENSQSAETEQSHYFTKKNDMQHRLGEDFFKQPCISLAKAFLGKVMLSSHLNLTSIYFVRMVSKSHLMLCRGYAWDIVCQYSSKVHVDNTA